MSCKLKTLSQAAFVVLALVAILAFPASAAEPAKYLTIPIYFLTDRDRQGDTFGFRRRYPFFCQHEMYYGTAFVTVKNVDHKSDQALFDQLGWKASDKKPPKIYPKDEIVLNEKDPKNSSTKIAFATRLKDSLIASKQDKLCVYVHGACDGFEECTSDAADMAYHMEKPTVLYSWPSRPKWRSYFIDGSNSEWSQGHFNTFCSDLLELQSKFPMHVIFMSHSMGNRLVIRSLPITYGKGLVDEWELMSPDIDADTCRHYIMDLTPDSSKIRLFVSNKDKMLPLSQMLSGGYYRLGEASNVAHVPTRLEKLAPGQIERIDFTAVDTGFIGHSIPSALVANLYHNNDPGKGLALVPETSVLPNRMVRWAIRKGRIGKATGGLPPSFCKRIVKVKKDS